MSAKSAVKVTAPSHTSSIPGVDRDRRRRPRLKLAYPLRLSRPDETSGVESKTEDVNCEGFYCISERPFSPNEKLECELVMSGRELGYRSGVDLVVRCKVEVIRIVADGLEPGFGIACRII